MEQSDRPIALIDCNNFYVSFSAEEIAERVEELRNPGPRKPRAASPAHAQAGVRGPHGDDKPACSGKPKKKKFYASKPKGK